MSKAEKAKKLSPKMESLRRQLDEQRLEILSMYEHDLKVGQGTSDEGAEDLVDRATSSYNREFMLSISGSERQILLEIEEALERIETDEFGQCVHCGEKIAPQRLQALPWARYCIDCQEQAEQGLL